MLYVLWHIPQIQKRLAAIYIIALCIFLCVPMVSCSQDTIRHHGNESSTKTSESSSKLDTADIILHSKIDNLLVNKDMKPQGATLSEQIAYMENILSRQHTALLSEADKRSRLDSNLNVITQMGCVLESKIDAIMLTIDAKPLDARELGISLSQNDFPAKNSESEFQDATITVEFGKKGGKPIQGSSKIPAFFTDTSALKTKYNLLITDLPKNIKINDIHYIQIIKPHTIIRNKYTKDKEQRGMFGNKVRIRENYQFTEHHRYELKGTRLEIKSGEETYILTNHQTISHKFSYPSHVYRDMTLRTRQDFHNLLQRPCAP